MRWYGVLYMVAFLTAWFMLPKLAKYRDLKLNGDDWLYIVTWGVAGVLLGGRLGFVLLYQPDMAWHSPLAILFLNQGGMSSHGGFVGVGVALWLASRKLKISYWSLLDVVVVPAGVGLALGRIGNIINGELFVSAGAGWLAVLGNLIIALVSWQVLKQVRGKLNQPGLVLGVFLIMYSLSRFALELFREVELVAGLPAGWVYSMPLLLAGIWLVWRRGRYPDRP